MFSAMSFFTTSLFVLSMAASTVELRTPRVTLPLAKRINASGGAIKLVQHDQARAASLRARGAANWGDSLTGRADSASAAVTNVAVAYSAVVGIGSPVTVYNLLVDTNNVCTTIGYGQVYITTSTSKDIGPGVSCGGEEWLDTVSLGPGLTVVDQPIFVMTSGSQYYDGSLGLGPQDLSDVPTFLHNLFPPGTEEVLSVFFAPTTNESSTNGELTFGSVDPSKYTGDITYVPHTTTSPASSYRGFSQSITYGSETVLAETVGFADTGTTLILIATDAFDAYQSATNSTLDANTGLLLLTTTRYDALQNLNFIIGSVTFALTPNGQIWPRSLNTYIGGTTGSIYLIVNDLGSPSGQGLDFVNGQVFLERFYYVIDSTNQTIGFATSITTNAITN